MSTFLSDGLIGRGDPQHSLDISEVGFRAADWLVIENKPLDWRPQAERLVWQWDHATPQARRG